MFAKVDVQECSAPPPKEFNKRIHVLLNGKLKTAIMELKKTLDEWKKRKNLKPELRDVRIQHVIKIKQLCVVVKIKGT